MQGVTQGIRALAMLACGAAVVFGAEPSSPAFTTLYQFSGFPNDGGWPIGGVAIGPGGVLYGATEIGGNAGSEGWGVVYTLTPPKSAGGAWKEAVLWNFAGGPLDGNTPFSGVVLGSGGVLYGTTEYGGTRESGLVYSLTPAAGGTWYETIVHNFTGGDDGATPYAPVTVGADNVIYGTTFFGGLQGGGTVFALTPPIDLPPGVIHTFNAGSDGGYLTAPVVIGSGGVLYGTTSYGGTLGGGTVFSLTPPTTPGGAWTEDILYQFPAGPPGDGQSAVIGGGPKGALLGTTTFGGTQGLGSVFVLTPPASPGESWTLTTIYSFSGPDGQYPATGVVSTDGVMYGTTPSGGSYSYGTVFSLKPPAAEGEAWTHTVLHSFTGQADGAYPNNLTIGSHGILYGTTLEGGAAHASCVTTCGTVFALKP
jgi:uncharacterized repeat protein (TIGR03803 family)